MKIIGIYIIFNRISKLVYVGSSFDINKRFSKHKNQLRNGNHPNRHLQFAYTKYGEDSLKFTCIKRIEYQIDDTQLRLLEQELIDKISPKRLYNLCPVAGSTKGKKHTQETKDKIRESVFGKEFQSRQKPVLQIDILTGEVINEFKTSRFAGIALSINHAHIFEICKGSKSRKTAGGFIWKYKNSQGIV